MHELIELPGLTEHMARIKVIGVGGGGCNAVDRMIAEGVQQVEFVAINTDAQALHHSAAHTCIQIGTRLTRGLGSGGNPATGQRSAEETSPHLAASLKDSDMVFITAGMGGGTGTGAAPTVAAQARQSGALTVGVVTLPFSFEGKHRRQLAEEGIEHLRACVDTLIVIPNDRLLHTAERHTTMLEAFRLADQVLYHGIQGIAELITRRGLINVDFADVHTIMAEAGTAWMAIGEGSGQGRMVEAITNALQSPLIEGSIEGAYGVLCNIVGGPDLSISEINDGLTLVQQMVDPEAHIIVGAVPDPTITHGTVRVTLIATGFQQTQPHIQRSAARPTSAAPVAPTSTKERQAPTEPPPVPAEAPAEAPRAQAPALSLAVGEQSDTYLELPPFLRRRNERRRQRPPEEDERV